MNNLSYKFIVALVFLYLIPMIIWWAVMSLDGGLVISYDNQNWGAFGSFVGGVLSPIFTLVSVIYIVKSINENRDMYELTAVRIEKEDRKLFILKLSELFEHSMSKSTEDIQYGLSERVPKFKPTVRANMYDYNKRYNTLSEVEKERLFGVVGNLTCNAENAFHSTMDVLLSANDEQERSELLNLVWAAYDINDMVELFNYNKKCLLWGNLKSSPLLDSLVKLNSHCSFFKDVSTGYSKAVPEKA